MQTLFYVHNEGGLIIYTILHAFCDYDTICQTRQIITNTYKNCSFITKETLEEAENTSMIRDIAFFIVFLDKKPNDAIRFLLKVQKNKKFQNKTIIILSNRIDYLTTAFLSLKSFEYFLLPFDKENIRKISDLIENRIQIYQKLDLYNRYALNISTSDFYCHIPCKEILFIEAINHKCYIHTANKEIPVLLPLYKIKENIPEKGLIQTHRSFLINTENILKIDKNQHPWVVSFSGCSKTAFISRNYKKLLSENLPLTM